MLASQQCGSMRPDCVRIWKVLRETAGGHTATHVLRCFHAVQPPAQRRSRQSEPGADRERRAAAAAQAAVYGRKCDGAAPTSIYAALMGANHMLKVGSFAIQQR